MKRLILGALAAALCVAPGVSRAVTPDAPRTAAPIQLDAQARTASHAGSQGGEDEASDDASDYAERERAAPHVEEFAGGGDGVYITTGALVAVAVLVLLLIAL